VNNFIVPAALPLVEIVFDTHWIGGWVGLRASMDKKQEVLGRTNPLLSFDITWTTLKMMRPTGECVYQAIA
jgi:hypothetical protein